MKKILAVAVLMLVCASVAFAAAPPSPLSYYVGAGFAKFLESGAPGGSIAAQAGVDYLVTPDISVGVMAGYYMLGSTTSPDGNTKIKSSVIPITASAAYHIASQGSFKPRVEAGAGIYMNRASTDVTYLGQTVSVSGSDSKFGFNVGAGFNIDSGKSSMIYGAEARFHLIPSASTDTAGNSTSAKMISIVATLGFK